MLDKLQAKKEELQKEAAKKAAEVALEKSKQAAKSAVTNAGKTLEKVLFGDAPESEKEPTSEAKQKAAGDKLRAAAERQKVREESDAKERAEREHKERQLERDVDDELAALKKKLGK